MQHSVKIMRMAPADINSMVDIAIESIEESRYKSMPRNKKKIHDLFAAFTAADSKTHLAIKCVLNGKIIGYFLGFRSYLDFSDSPIGVERSFFVQKAHRGTRAAILMYKKFFQWCDENGFLHDYMLINHSYDNTKTYRLCERMGMKEVGRIFERTA